MIKRATTINPGHERKSLLLQRSRSQPSLNYVPCPSAVEFSKTLESVANHAFLDKTRHEAHCLSIQEFDGNDPDIRLLAKSIITVKSLLEHNTKINKGRYLSITYFNNEDKN